MTTINNGYQIILTKNGKRAGEMYKEDVDNIISMLVVVSYDDMCSVKITNDKTGFNWNLESPLTLKSIQQIQTLLFADLSNRN